MCDVHRTLCIQPTNVTKIPNDVIIENYLLFYYFLTRLEIRSPRGDTLRMRSKIVKVDWQPTLTGKWQNPMTAGSSWPQEKIKRLKQDCGCV